MGAYEISEEFLPEATARQLDAVMGDAPMREMRGRPGFAEMCRRSAAVWRMPPDGEARAFAEAMRDLGRLMGGLWALYLHNTPGGLTLARLTALMEAGKVWDVDPARQMRFAKAAMEAGLNLRERPITQFTSVTNVFRALIDMPADLHAPLITLSARQAAKEQS